MEVATHSVGHGIKESMASSGGNTCARCAPNVPRNVCAGSDAARFMLQAEGCLDILFALFA